MKKIIKIKKHFYIWAAASLICMILIFWLSSRTADQSGEMSSSLTHGLFGFMQDRGGDAGGDPGSSGAGVSDIMETLEVIVRKSAHFIIYFALGFFVANTIRQVTDNKKYIFWISLCWSSFYGATDEFHQYFVPGRSAMWQDWAIDTLGALCGVGAAFFAVWLLRKIKNTKTGGSLDVQ
jgi:VanZ family protein